MKILNPREYKEQNPNAHLNDYMTYLENAQLAAEETLESIKSLPIKEETIKQIKQQIEDIFKISLTIEEYLGQVVLNTINTLPADELQSYFDFSERQSQIEEERRKLTEEKNRLSEELSEIDRKISEGLYENGRVNTFYQACDVKKFFEKNITEPDYVERLLESTELTDLKSDLIKAIRTECNIQSIDLSNQEIEDTATNILDLIKRSKRVLEYSSEAKSQLVNIILSDSGIGKFLPESFDKNSYLYIIQDIINFPKLDTDFYTKLPTTLRQCLLNERLSGKIYNVLETSYQAFLKGEEIPSQDLNNEEKQAKMEIEKKLSKIDYDLSCLSAEERSHIDFIENNEAMRSVLREMVLNLIDKNQPSLQTIDSTISEAEEKRNALKEELLKACSLIKTKKIDVQKAREILVNPNYQQFFSKVEKNNARRIYNAFGVTVTEEIVKPILDEEEKRNAQIEIMDKFQSELESLCSQIETKKKKSNFITRRLSSYKREMKELEDKYQELITEVFNNLQAKELFHVNTPRISNESTIGNIICIPSTSYDTPEKFDDLQGAEQTFWDMTTGIDVNIQKKFLELKPGYDNWGEYVKNLMTKQKTLVNKLFSFEKDNEGYYHFAISSSEREELKEVQKEIYAIAKSLYENRKAFRQGLNDGITPLDDNIVSELEHYLGKGINPSRENLVNYIELTEKEIEELRNLLLKNKEYCKSLGIELPEELSIEDEAQEEVVIDLDEDIKKLNIENVTSLEEAIKYRKLLLGLEDYTATPEQAKQYYLSRSSKKKSN